MERGIAFRCPQVSCIEDECKLAGVAALMQPKFSCSWLRAHSCPEQMGNLSLSALKRLLAWHHPLGPAPSQARLQLPTLKLKQQELPGSPASRVHRPSGGFLGAIRIAISRNRSEAKRLHWQAVCPSRAEINQPLCVCVCIYIYVSTYIYIYMYAQILRRLCRRVCHMRSQSRSSSEATSSAGPFSGPVNDNPCVPRAACTVDGQNPLFLTRLHQFQLVQSGFGPYDLRL